MVFSFAARGLGDRRPPPLDGLDSDRFFLGEDDVDGRDDDFEDDEDEDEDSGNEQVRADVPVFCRFDVRPLAPLTAPPPPPVRLLTRAGFIRSIAGLNGLP